MSCLPCLPNLRGLEPSDPALALNSLVEAADEDDWVMIEAKPLHEEFSFVEIVRTPFDFTWQMLFDTPEQPFTADAKPGPGLVVKDSYFKRKGSGASDSEEKKLPFTQQTTALEEAGASPELEIERKNAPTEGSDNSSTAVSPSPPSTRETHKVSVLEKAHTLPKPEKSVPIPIVRVSKSTANSKKKHKRVILETSVDQIKGRKTRALNVLMLGPCQEMILKRWTAKGALQRAPKTVNTKPSAEDQVVPETRLMRVGEELVRVTLWSLPPGKNSYSNDLYIRRVMASKSTMSLLKTISFQVLCLTFDRRQPAHLDGVKHTLKKFRGKQRRVVLVDLFPYFQFGVGAQQKLKKLTKMFPQTSIQSYRRGEIAQLMASIIRPALRSRSKRRNRARPEQDTHPHQQDPQKSEGPPTTKILSHAEASSTTSNSPSPNQPSSAKANL